MLPLMENSCLLWGMFVSLSVSCWMSFQVMVCSLWSVMIRLLKCRKIVWSVFCLFSCFLVVESCLFDSLNMELNHFVSLLTMGFCCFCFGFVSCCCLVLCSVGGGGALGGGGGGGGGAGGAGGGPEGGGLDGSCAGGGWFVGGGGLGASGGFMGLLVLVGVSGGGMCDVVDCLRCVWVLSPLPPFRCLLGCW